MRLPRRVVAVRLLGMLGVLGGFWASALHAQPAACSRPIEVPLAPVGQSVVIAADAGFSGVYPELLKSLERRHGCQFLFSAVPRARLELMFETGKADVLIPASRTPRRDEFGEFVPLISARPTLISLKSDRPALLSLKDLSERRDLRVVLVRGFDYGDEYQALVRELARQGRVTWESDAVSVARSLAAGAADLTLMAPSILIGAITGDARVQQLAERLRIEPVEELPWSESGAYLSRSSLGDGDRARLRELLEQGAKSGAVWRGFQKYYPAGSLNDSIRPR
ncbi:substrate-binding periplasmic protein [Roseateles aquae]|uniref:substrate-binding periplasmic protein n=1 Tax=Roseateles aquae TaxID=3077235 RepID=UPI0028EDF93A|nr:transporter substrate-binding domain-containing protein [Paucibacter sp. APW11]